jgi:hypothetical protein
MITSGMSYLAGPRGRKKGSYLLPHGRAALRAALIMPACQWISEDDNGSGVVLTHLVQNTIREEEKA